MKHSFRKKLDSGKPLIGTIVTLPCPQIAEILSNVGFDWLFIDAEHAPLGMGDIQQILQAAQDRCPCIVRIPANDEVYVKQVLDLGADGIIVPLVNTAQVAERIVMSSKYPPAGTRSVGIGRAQRYGLNFANYVEHANDEIAVIVQIEHVNAAENIESILDIEGIDAIFLGPYDLSGSLGKPGNISDPDVRGYIDHVREACLKRGQPIGIFGISVEDAKPFLQQGYSLIVIGIDIMLLGESAAGILATIRK